MFVGAAASPRAIKVLTCIGKRIFSHDIGSEMKTNIYKLVRWISHEPPLRRLCQTPPPSAVMETIPLSSQVPFRHNIHGSNGLLQNEAYLISIMTQGIALSVVRCTRSAPSQCIVTELRITWSHGPLTLGLVHSFTLLMRRAMSCF